MDELCAEAVEELTRRSSSACATPELAKVDAMMAPLRAAAEDRWPRELYVGGI